LSSGSFGNVAEKKLAPGKLDVAPKAIFHSCTAIR
jgi:hypothetical protein